MNAIASSDWQSPGKKLQAAIAIIRAESPRRDIRGRFVHQYSPAEITLRALKAYAPVVSHESQSMRDKDICVSSVSDNEPLITNAEREALKIDPEPLPIIPKFSGVRMFALLAAIAFIGFVVFYPDIAVKIFAGLYALAEGVVVWEGR